MIGHGSETRRHRASCCLIALTFVATVLMATPGLSQLAGSENSEVARALGLRVQDVTVREDGLIVLVARTYAPRPLGSGQLSIRPRGTSGSRSASGVNQPFLSIISGEMWNEPNDATCTSEIVDDETGQTLVFNFVSQQATVNRETDGPLFVLLLEASPDLVPGDLFTLDLELTSSNLLGEEGELIAISPRSGQIFVEPDTAPITLGITSESTIDDGHNEIVAWVSSRERLSLRSGYFVLTYPPAAVIGRPSVEVPWEPSEVDIEVDNSVPGVIRAEIDARAGVWSDIPGPLLTIRMTPRSDPSTFRLDLSAETWLENEYGDNPELALEGATVATEFGLLHADGFESGTLSAWIGG